MVALTKIIYTDMHKNLYIWLHQQLGKQALFRIPIYGPYITLYAQFLI